MKKVLAILPLIFLTTSLNAAIFHLKNGVTYCTSEFDGNFVINWKNNSIDLNLAGSDRYKIVKESTDPADGSYIITARDYFFGGSEYTEIKLFSTPSGDYYRFLNSHKNQYSYNPAKLKCWNENNI